ncbi:hypothetical protein [Methylicorpusculum sp.]|uniref:hypothetical protein n=1 Tax=Methylicorpusculum sp. TaxID=2713644 RepID=UPI00272499FD|nr:hypothetical protein [Methylicorpusculum sp.]MDO8846095.1 hypothetical protein [Methylicorpusculum sp.]
MNTTAKTKWKHPMVIDDVVLFKVESLLQSRVAKPIITASCADSTDHEFSTVNALLKFENAKNSRIESVRFWAKKDGDWSKQAWVSFTPNSFRTFEVEVKGTQAT